MRRTLFHVLCAALLITVLGTRCALACLGTAYLGAGAHENGPHACCHKTRSGGKTVPPDGCSGPSFVVEKRADSASHSVELPSFEAVHALTLSLVPAAFEPRRQQPLDSPPDILALHHTLLI